jgi:hypothetical protein
MGVIGPPEILDVDPEARYFTPSKGVPNAELKRGGRRQKCSRTLRGRQQSTDWKRFWRRCFFGGMSPTAPSDADTRKWRVLCGCIENLQRPRTRYLLSLRRRITLGKQVLQCLRQGLRHRHLALKRGRRLSTIV